ncbi:hypothetical protein CSA37_02360 [Candidatus Fermentibacteria bacterium]|nr:MAG: hypothetical protein CSA37_02360 [Candidatus Fermentibacteria bacterium]
MELSVCAMGYGYWDLFQKGGRVLSVNPSGATIAGATAPTDNSPLHIFSNPSALAGVGTASAAIGGWGTGWREEIHYDAYCNDVSRFNKGAMSPRGSFALAVPLGSGFTAVAGISTVAQYEMRGMMKVYQQGSGTYPVLWKIMTADSTGDLNEAMAVLAGNAGKVRLGLAAGTRFGSGELTVYSNRAESSGMDSTCRNTWESSSFALRAGASIDMDFVRAYTSFVSGDDRYSSYAGAGAFAFFSFLKGGFMGTEIGLFDGDELFMNGFISYPWAFDGMNFSLGINGYRPDNAQKTGMGISYGIDYAFRPHKVTAAYQWNSRYRNGTAVDTEKITWIYDSGESFVIGYEIGF